MSLLSRFDPPAYLDDFDAIPGQREAWHDFVSLNFDASIEAERAVVTTNHGAAPGIVQFFNAARYDPGGPLVEQAITWNAFPRELVRRFGRERALVEADQLWPLSAYRGHFDPDRPEVTTPPASDTMVFRPHDEYCEWHVTRDPQTGQLVRITFSSEPPEYWTALFGGTIGVTEDRGVSFPGSPGALLALYRALVDPRVVLEDLIVQADFVGGEGEPHVKGSYNPYNKWNTTHGIAHLCAPPNSLGAEIRLGADATVLYRDGAGRPLTQPDALICGAAYGGPNRNSDPTIGSTVNALARLGALITIANPVGLYMDHIDTTGWELPDGIAPRACIRVVRGAPRMIERMVVEVPPETGRTLSDLTIGGAPVRYGGQIAECITVKLVGCAAPLAGVTGNDTLDAEFHGLVPAQGPHEIYTLASIERGTPPGLVPAFSQYARNGAAHPGAPRGMVAALAPQRTPQARAVTFTRPGRSKAIR
jgi:hypothetical protein